VHDAVAQPVASCTSPPRRHAGVRDRKRSLARIAPRFRLWALVDRLAQRRIVGRFFGICSCNTSIPAVETRERYAPCPAIETPEYAGVCCALRW
jgi:hypothetical protein